MADRNWIEEGQRTLSIEMEGLAAVRDALGTSFTLAVELMGGCRGRIAVAGIGKSGLVGRKIAATLSSTGTPAFFLHPVEAAHGDLGSLRGDDVVLALSNSGRTDELNAILPALRGLGIQIIAITGNAASPLAELADCVLNSAVPREACSLNLAPTASTTAQLALGDALAVAVSQYKAFTRDDFRRFHPGGSLGQRLNMPLSALMHTENLPRVQCADTLAAAVAVLHNGGLGTVLVTDAQGMLEGIVTDGDIRRLVFQDKLDLSGPVSSVMIKTPHCGNIQQGAAELLELMERAAITVLPIVDEKRNLAGVIHMHDLLGKGSVRF